MQLFVMDADSKTAAKLLWDRDPLRANKQILECCQCLAACGLVLPKMGGGSYGVTHKHHPIVRWMQEHDNNLRWVIHFTGHLLSEFKHRRHKVHGCFGAYQAVRHIAEDEAPNVVHRYVSQFDLPGDTVYQRYQNLINHKQRR